MQSLGAWFKRLTRTSLSPADYTFSPSALGLAFVPRFHNTRHDCVLERRSHVVLPWHGHASRCHELTLRHQAEQLMNAALVDVFSRDARFTVHATQGAVPWAWSKVSAIAEAVSDPTKAAAAAHAEAGRRVTFTLQPKNPVLEGTRRSGVGGARGSGPGDSYEMRCKD